MTHCKPDPGWTMVQPGCYIDPAGHGHVFPEEVIAEMQCRHPEMGFEHSRADYELVLRVIREQLLDIGLSEICIWVKPDRSES